MSAQPGVIAASFAGLRKDPLGMLGLVIVIVANWAYLVSRGI